MLRFVFQKRVSWFAQLLHTVHRMGMLGVLMSQQALSSGELDMEAKDNLKAYQVSCFLGGDERIQARDVDSHPLSDKITIEVYSLTKLMTNRVIQSETICYVVDANPIQGRFLVILAGVWMCRYRVQAMKQEALERLQDLWRGRLQTHDLHPLNVWLAL